MNCTFCLGKIRTINILGCIQGIYIHNYDGDGDGDFLDDHAGGDDNGDYHDVGMYICEVSVCFFVTKRVQFFKLPSSDPKFSCETPKIITSSRVSARKERSPNI